MNEDNNLLKRQRRRYKWQFGNEQPYNNDICRLCGKSYGLHYGSECPVIGKTLNGKELNPPHLEGE